MSPVGIEHPHANRWLIAIAVMSSAVMEVLDTSVVNVSLPHIAGSLSATVDEATWVLTSYLVANAVILPITGWLANYIGRKRLLLIVVTGFTASSVLCGLAPNLPALIFFRVLQGTTGGGLQPLSQAVLLEEFPGGNAARLWDFGGWASWPPRSWDRPWAAGSPTRTRGAGCSISTCRSASPA